MISHQIIKNTCFAISPKINGLIWKKYWVLQLLPQKSHKRVL